MSDELEWVESYAKDMYDVNEFKKAFCQVMKPLGGGMSEPIVFEPYDYQKEWSDDGSDKRIVIKPRQIGFSVNESLDTLHSALANKNYRKLFTSLKQEQATKNIKVIRDSISLMPDSFKPKLKRKSDRLLEFDGTGSEIHALPSSNDGARGFSGDVFLDEFAFVPNDKELLRSILSVAVREGYRISMGSTPMGQRGEFHRIVKEIGWDTNKVWLGDTESEKRAFFKEYNKVLNENETDWSFHVVAWWMCPDLTWKNILKATETEADREQEYGLGFLDETTSMFSYDILQKRSNSKKPIFQEDRRYTRPKQVSRVAGLDPAETTNKTAYVIFDYYYSQRKWYKRFQKTWHNVPLNVYVDEITKYHQYFNVSHMNMDGTGMGVGVHGMFKDRGFNDNNLRFIKFTQPLKHDLVHNALSLYETEPQAIFTDPDMKYNKQFHQVRKEINRYGKPVYTGKIEGKDDDIFWATMLALMDNVDFDTADLMFFVDDRSKGYSKTKYTSSDYYV